MTGRYRVPKRDPRGIAKRDYTAPCPHCGAPPRAGDAVVRIGTGRGPNKWWHEACREAYLSSLRKQRLDGA